ncbi:MAG: hypothetical protein DRH12_18215 [Deltaproteobacteria bacterium]|nr:MAG: hypothetical protein DRH12_18215 [Deltaproteobacteria bacterium]
MKVFKDKAFIQHCQDIREKMWSVIYLGACSKYGRGSFKRPMKSPHMKMSQDHLKNSTRNRIDAGLQPFFANGRQIFYQGPEAIYWQVLFASFSPGLGPSKSMLMHRYAILHLIFLYLSTYRHLIWIFEIIFLPPYLTRLKLGLNFFYNFVLFIVKIQICRFSRFAFRDP